ncbi:LAMI_0H00496g1_1 [Lachancea mirantina]|uniref:LAMI_0H00496g1_1 n=1 Tax=Lachancea mirantina TaxID=1230905 RepID=A0A1G4KDK2_9SACH|nr:LAMI_0H00496g1_1 [Lachancea mirantina]
MLFNASRISSSRRSSVGTTRFSTIDPHSTSTSTSNANSVSNKATASASTEAVLPASSNLSSKSQFSTVRSTTRSTVRSSFETSELWSNSSTDGIPVYASTGAEQSATSATGSHESTSSPEAPTTQSASWKSLTAPSGDTWLPYTRSYVFTAPSTTITTDLVRSTLLPTKRTSSYTAPTAVITTDISYYKKWLDGSINGADVTPSTNNKNTIIGSVVGSVGGFLLICFLTWFLLYRRRRKPAQITEKSFSHDIGCRLDYPTTAQGADETIRMADDEEFIRGKYKSFGKKIPLWRKPDAAPSDDENHVVRDGEKRTNPFSEEFDFQKRLPLPPPVPTRSSPARSFMSTISTSTNGSTSSDDISSIYLARPTGEAGSQSFLTEVI